MLFSDPSEPEEGELRITLILERKVKDEQGNETVKRYAVMFDRDGKRIGASRATDDDEEGPGQETPPSQEAKKGIGDALRDTPAELGAPAELPAGPPVGEGKTVEVEPERN